MSVDPTTNGRLAPDGTSPADEASGRIDSAGWPGAPIRARPAGSPPARPLPGSGQIHRHVLVALVLDKPGVLNRVSSLMRARNFNIDSLAVSRTDQADVSRMTITLRGDDVAVEQAAKQLYRLIDVLKVQDLSAERRVEHELALLKVRATNSTRSEIVKIVELYRGRVVDVAQDSVIVESSGTVEETDALVALLGGFGIKEMVRTGAIVMGRGSGVIGLKEG